MMAASAIPLYDYQRPGYYDAIEEFLPQKRTYSRFFRIGKSHESHSPSRDDVFINRVGNMLHRQDYIPDLIDKEQRVGFNMGGIIADNVQDHFLDNDSEELPNLSKRGMFRFGKMPYFMRNGRTFLRTYYDKPDSTATIKSGFWRIG
jgi:hypothetical protein